ncbi:hypothetical protein XPA_008276 [Xanthoria parietina]
MSSQVVVPSSLRIGQYFAIILGFGLSTIAIAARLYTKLGITRKLLSEDYFALAGYLGLLAFLSLAIVIGKNGGDTRHKAYLSTVETIIYDPIIVLVKISILLQYVTLFVVHRRNLFHYAIHLTIWIIVLFYIAVTFMYIFGCNPRRKLWIPSTPGHCQYEHSRGVFSGSINIVSDFVILILPLPVILRLQMPLAKRLRLTLVFSFGFLACVTSIVRLVYSLQLDPDQGSTAYQLNINKQGLWAFAEISMGIIVSCMPLVHKSFKHLLTKFPSTSSFRKFPSSGGSSSWRRLLGRSSSSGESSSRKGDSKASEFVAPQIGTLNMTRASFSVPASDLPSSIFQSEKNLPTIPMAVHASKALPTQFGARNAVQDGYFPGKMDDPESAMARYREDTQTPDFPPSWQNQDCTAETRRNETRRARYDLYPK